MKAVYEFNGVELTEQQFKTLSWLAYYNRHSLDAGERGEDTQQYYGSYIGVRCIAENVLKVPSNLIYDVCINNYAKGLRNCNKIAEPQIWTY